MKKLVMFLAVAAVVCLVVGPALAFENEFGGYFRTRTFHQRNFSGESKSDSQDVSRWDSRTRLFYTAIFSDEFKFINKFEMDAVWGDENASSYGDISADGVSVEVKNSYVDFTMGSMNFKVGAQPKTIARGFVFDDDFSGVIARYQSEELIFPFIWIRAYEGGPGEDDWDGDVDYFVVDPRFKVGRDMWLNPFAMYVYSNDASGWANTSGNTDLDVYFLGVNGDFGFEGFSLWFTAVYEGGSADLTAAAESTVGDDSLDVSAYMVAVGGSANVGPVEVHGQAFYLSGDDDPTDGDAEAFFVPKGQAYYWSEIMGCGIFDNQKPAGVPGTSANDSDNLSNIWAVNLGVSHWFTDKLQGTLDVWYAELAQDTPTADRPNGDGNWSLGTEVDLKFRYKLLENLNLDVVAAYLFAGDAIYNPALGTKNEDDPWEIGAQLSFRF